MKYFGHEQKPHFADRRAVGTLGHAATGAGPRAGLMAASSRLFVEAVRWRMCGGMSWRDLPERLGAWPTVFTHLSRWKKNGGWAKVLAALQDEDNVHELLVNSTTVRVHKYAAGALKIRPRKCLAAHVAGCLAGCI